MTVLHTTPVVRILVTKATLHYEDSNKTAKIRDERQGTECLVIQVYGTSTARAAYFYAKSPAPF